MRVRQAAFAAAFAAAVVAAQLTAARADEPGRLAAARAAKARVDYRGALAEIDRALAAGDLRMEDTHAALRLRGEVLAVLGRAADATDAFAELLALDPRVEIDPGLAPRVSSAFEAAAGRQPAPVRVSCEVDRAGRLRVALDPGSSRRARLVRVERTEAGSPRVVRAQVTAPSEIVLRRAARIACFAIDEPGNALAAGPGWDRPIAWSPPETALAPPSAALVGTDRSEEETRSRPLWRNPWLWGGAAAAVAGAGATFSWLAHRDQNRLDELTADSQMYQYAAAREVLERGESRTRWARGLYLGAGILAAGAIACALVPPNAWQTRSAARRLTIGPLAVDLRLEF